MKAKDVKRRHSPYRKLKAFFVENNIKQSEVAELLGKSVSALNQNLNGTGGDFSLSEVRILCNLYGLSSDAFFINQKVS